MALIEDDGTTIPVESLFPSEEEVAAGVEKTIALPPVDSVG